MAEQNTNIDALALHLSSGTDFELVGSPVGSLGNLITGVPVQQNGFKHKSGQFPLWLTGTTTEQIGDMQISFAGGSAKFKEPGASDFGAWQAIANNENKLLEGFDSTKNGVIVSRKSAESFEGNLNFEITPVQFGFIAQGWVIHSERIAGKNTYRGGALINTSEKQITNITVKPENIGPEITSGLQLPASGAGTIQPVPIDGEDDGFLAIVTNAGVLREIVYYYAKAGNAASVNAAGRAQFGTIANAGVATDKAYYIHNLAPAIDDLGTSGLLQIIVDEETPPSGVTWKMNPEDPIVFDLNPGKRMGLWLWRSIAVNQKYNLFRNINLDVSFDYEGTTYFQKYRGQYCLPDDTLERYELFKAEDALPNLSGSPDATSTTLPFTLPFSAPLSGTKEVNSTVLFRDKFGMKTITKKYTKIVVDSAGSEISQELSAPYDVFVYDVADGKVQVNAKYRRSNDASPANQWNLYIRTDGTDPDPSVDIPATVSINNLRLNDGAVTLQWRSTSYEYLTDFRVLVRVERTSDGTESANKNIVQHTVSTFDSMLIAHPHLFAGNDLIKNINPIFNAAEDVVMLGATVGAIPFQNSVFIFDFFLNQGLLYCLQLAANIKIFGHDSSMDIWTHTPASGAGDPSGWEYVSTTENYICVNGQRRVKVTPTRIECNVIKQPRVITDWPGEGPIVALEDKTLFMLYNVWDARYEAALEVDVDGNLLVPGIVRQKY